uniref:Uncharacterized protein n=1 Tax=Noctiluca scintillans TaxID=2966 RepID=A0A7S0ZMN7_NOCSC
MPRAEGKRNGSVAVPRLAAKDATWDSFSAAYSRHHAVLVTGCLEGRSARKKALSWKSLRRVYTEHPQMVRRTFCLESKGTEKTKGCEVDEATSLFKTATLPPGRWYASFVVQRNRDALSQFLSALPFSVPPFLMREGRARTQPVRHSNAVWVFFGANPATRALRGRPEHTDAVPHSGTWHLQVHGSKVWTIRPTTELLKVARFLRGVGEIKVKCDAGDVLCINTRLWRHRTHIPSGCGLSMSVARDIWLEGSRRASCDMANLVGQYATRPIPRGTVIFTEHDSPNLELQRSKRPNCAVRDADGTVVVVAKRRIEAGDWFCISESEDE